MTEQNKTHINDCWKQGTLACGHVSQWKSVIAPHSSLLLDSQSPCSMPELHVSSSPSHCSNDTRERLLPGVHLDDPDARHHFVHDADPPVGMNGRFAPAKTNKQLFLTLGNATVFSPEPLLRAVGDHLVLLIVPYLKMPKSFPNQVWTGSMRAMTASPARHEGPIQYHRRALTPTA